MAFNHRPRTSIFALLLVACSGSGDGSDEQSLQSDDPNAFITEEEAEAQRQKDAKDSNTSGDSDTKDSDAKDSDTDGNSVLPDVEAPPVGIDGSGVVVAKGDSGGWAIANDGANFTGPPLQAGEGPENAEECPSQSSITTTTESVGEHICFYSADDSETPAARIDQVIESAEGEDYVRIRLTLNPNFVDNSYGETAVGWGGDEAAAAGAETEEMAMMPPDEMAMMPPDEMAMMDGKMPKPPKKPKGKGGHTFEDLVGSDHAEIQITDSNGEVVLHFKVDYLSEDPTAPSGYSSLGVSGGEGKVLVGDPDWILEATSSMDRNFNACGYSEYTEDSPEPPNLDSPGEAENWDYRVVYEVWVSLDAFGDAGFGAASIEFVHASPSKASSNTVDVTPGDCPPDVPPSDEPPPDDEGSGGSGGGEGSGGSAAGGSGGTSSGVTPEKAR